MDQDIEIINTETRKEKIKNIIINNNIKHVITTGPPHSTHLIGLKIKKDFEISLSMYFGNKDHGADGMAFVLQKSSNAAGTAGIGIGYQGIDTSFAVEFDTYQNGGEPPYDHCAVQRDGNLNHTGQYNLVPFFSISDGDIEDDREYDVIIKYSSFFHTPSSCFCPLGCQVIQSPFGLPSS